MVELCQSHWISDEQSVTLLLVSGWKCWGIGPPAMGWYNIDLLQRKHLWIHSRMYHTWSWSAWQGPRQSSLARTSSMPSRKLVVGRNVTWELKPWSLGRSEVLTIVIGGEIITIFVTILKWCYLPGLQCRRRSWWEWRTTTCRPPSESRSPWGCKWWSMNHILCLILWIMIMIYNIYCSIQLNMAWKKLLKLGAVLEIFAIFKKWLPSFKSNTLFYIHKAGCYAVISHSPTHPHISLNWNDPS